MLKSTFTTAACLSLLATGASAADLEVTYSVAATAVPTMTEWAMILMGAALAGFALVAVSRKQAGRGIALGMALLISAVAVGADQARANDGNLSLDGGSPDRVTLVGNQGVITVTNDTGNTVTITSRQIINGAGLWIYGFQTSCQTGTDLAVGQSCTVGFGPNT